MTARTAPILLLTFVNAIGGTLLIPVLPFVVRDLGYSDFVFALLIAAYPAAQFFAAPILGSLADYLGRKPVLIVSQAGTVLSWVLFMVAYWVDGGAALALIAVSRVVDGLTGGNASVAAAYLADVTTEDERTGVFSVQGAIMGVALIIGPALGAFTAATSIGFLGPALLATGISLITLVWLMVSLEESLAPGDRTQSLDVNPFHQLNLIGKVRRLQGRRPLLRLFGVQVLLTFAFSAYTTIVVLWYVDRLGVSETTAGLLLVAVGVFLIFNELVTVRLAEKRLGDFRTLALGLLVMPAGFIAVRFPTTVAWFLPASFLLNVGMALSLPSLQTLITNSADERQEGEVQGINTSLAAVASTTAPVAVGVVYASGGGELALPIIAFVAFGAAALLVVSAPVITGVAPRACRLPHREHGPVHSLAFHCGGGHRTFGLQLWGGHRHHRLGVHSTAGESDD